MLDPETDGRVNAQPDELALVDPVNFAGLVAGAEVAACRPSAEADGKLLAHLAVGVRDDMLWV